ncbi:MAG: glycine hydroxymethyltransferase, partial [Thermoproteota archaeon]|nr:glycine hydroxymethyltransferase [Thermoproteota archaeon]
MEKIRQIVENQNRWRRKECINMIASESVMSPLAESYSKSDFEGRYNEHTGQDIHYKGTKYSYEIEELCNDLFRKKFDTKFADVRPISGAMANQAVYTAFTKPADIIVCLGIPNGAHASHTSSGLAGAMGLKSVDMYFDREKMNINPEKTIELIERVHPKLVMFGASMFLFPEPVEK